ncbi:MAG: hypothetical protein AAF004_03345 [Pseudomonadota bacterium]
MNRDKVIEDNLVDRYLLGQLSEVDAMAFEDFYASSPETMAELEQAAQMIDGFAHLARNSDIADKTIASLSAARERKTSTMSRLLTSPMYSAAATLVAVAALVLVGLNSQMNSAPQDVSMQVASNTSVNFPVFTLGATRGSEQGVEIAVGDSSELVLTLDVMGSAETSFSASLQNTQGDLIQRFDALHMDSYESLNMRLSTAMVPDGDYRIVVRGAENPAETLTFLFSTAR